MRQFTDFEVYAQLKKWETENGGTLTEDDYKRIVDIYGRVINDDVNKTKGKLEQESMITYLADSVQAQIDKGENANMDKTWTYIENHFSDNKHFEFYRNFIGDEATKQLQKTLINNKLPSSILRGIKAKVYIHQEVVINGDAVEITGYFDPSPDGAEDNRNFFVIRKNGDVIFNWEANAEEDNTIPSYNLSDEELDELESRRRDLEKRRNTTKQGKPTRSKYIKSYIVGNDIIQERYTSNNQVIFQDKRGRFVSRSKVL